MAGPRKKDRSGNDMIKISELVDFLNGQKETCEREDGKLISLAELEKRHIQLVLSRVDCIEEAARILGITTVTLWRKRKQFGLA